MGDAHLESVDAEVDEVVELVFVPLPRCRVRNVDDSETWLPQVPSARFIVSILYPCPGEVCLLPGRAVLAFDQVTAFDGLLEDGRQLGDVGVDWYQVVSINVLSEGMNSVLTPDADLDSVLLLDLRQVRLRIGEVLGIKRERAPKRQSA